MCRFTDHLKAEAAEWVERIENTNVVGFCAQGIVRVVTSIPTSTVLFPAEELHPIMHAGFIRDIHSSYLGNSSERCSVESSSRDCVGLFGGNV